jgi:plasmid stabilization system protein ParE
MAHRVAEEVDVELDDIWLYTARQSGSFEIADKVADAITGCFVSLGRNPYMGRRRDHDLALGLRAFPVGSYIIVYRIDDEGAVILHVFHGGRDIESFFHH